MATANIAQSTTFSGSDESIVKVDFGTYHTLTGTDYSSIMKAVRIEDIPSSHILSLVWNGTVYTVLYYK